MSLKCGWKKKTKQKRVSVASYRYRQRDYGVAKLDTRNRNAISLNAILFQSKKKSNSVRGNNSYQNHSDNNPIDNFGQIVIYIYKYKLFCFLQQVSWHIILLLLINLYLGTRIRRYDLLSSLEGSEILLFSYSSTERSKESCLFPLQPVAALIMRRYNFICDDNANKQCVTLTLGVLYSLGNLKSHGAASFNEVFNLQTRNMNRS